MAKAFRFHYLYRDSGNYKTFGHKDFSNPNNLTLEEATQAIRSSLISTEFFYPEQAGIKKFLFHRHIDDFSWYEFEQLEATESRHLHITIEKLFLNLKKQKF